MRKTPNPERPSWLARYPPASQPDLPLRLPPRPGIKLRRACPKCGVVHEQRRELLECLADHSQP